MKKKIPSTIKVRKIPDGSEPIYDTFIFFVDNHEQKEKYIRILSDEGFGTKNLPDAIEWHCTAFWDHALNQDQIIHSQKTRELLERAIAIPIWLRKNPDDYGKLSKKLFY